MAAVPKKSKRRTDLIIQGLALLGAITMLILNQQRDPDIPDLFIWALFGLAYGARPETLPEFISGKR